MQTDKHINVLMIEDNECDIDIVHDIFEQSNYPVCLSVVKSAEDAICFLNKRGEYQKVETPSLIFLDLNLPLMSGLELLDVINENDNIRMIPVIVMTTSNNSQDITEAYKRCISCYITKPMDIIEFNSMIMDIVYIWLRIAQLPNG